MTASTWGVLYCFNSTGLVKMVPLCKWARNGWSLGSASLNVPASLAALAWLGPYVAWDRTEQGTFPPGAGGNWEATCDSLNHKLLPSLFLEQHSPIHWACGKAKIGTIIFLSMLSFSDGRLCVCPILLFLCFPSSTSYCSQWYFICYK